MIKLMYKASTKLSTVNTSQGQIQDFVLGGTKVGEGSGDRLRSPVGPWKLLGFEYLGSFSVNNFEAFCECDEVY